MSKRILIIGGGVIGLTTAWYCQQRGHQVVVLDRHDAHRDGCSFGNAGMVVPSHFVPLAAPGMIRLGLKWMWNPESPFHIRPRMSWDLLTWLWNFKRACTSRSVMKAAPLLRDLHLASRECLEQLHQDLPGGFGLVKRGMLMLCRTHAALEEEHETARLAHQLDVEAQLLDADATATLDPHVDMDICGAVYYPQDCFLSPDRLMSSLESELMNRGCEFHWRTMCTGFSHESDRVTCVETNTGTMEADEIVICGGVWSTDIAGQLELSLPMQAGKGYSVTLDKPCQLPTISSILTEARVAVTPMGTSLRFGGTMEIAGLNDSISDARVRGIIGSIPRYFPRFDPNDFASCQPWVGLRPCSPDGLPYLGRSSRWRNVLISTGHAMMGISLSAISGRIACEMIDESPQSISDLHLLSPDRYS